MKSSPPDGQGQPRSLCAFGVSLKKVLEKRLEIAETRDSWAPRKSAKKTNASGVEIGRDQIEFVPVPLMWTSPANVRRTRDPPPSALPPFPADLEKSRKCPIRIRASVCWPNHLYGLLVQDPGHPSLASSPALSITWLMSQNMKPDLDRNPACRFGMNLAPLHFKRVPSVCLGV